MDVIKEKIRKMYDSGALHITLGTFATKFVAFFGSIVVVRLMSKYDYGLMSYVENIYSYAFILAGLGLSNGILRYLVISEKNKEKQQFYNYIIKRSMVIDVLIAILLCVASVFVSFPNNYAGARLLIPVIALLLPFQDLLNEELYTIRAFFKNKLYAYLAFGSSALLIVGRIVGAQIKGVDGVLWSRVIINAIFALALLLFVVRGLFSREKVEPLSKENKKAVNSYSFQYMITNGFWAIFMLNDTFMLGLLLNDPTVLADYKVAYVLPGNISIFATAIGVFIGPYFTKNEKNLEWVRRNYKKVFLLSAGIVAAVAVGIAALANPLIRLMYGEEYLNTIGLMRVLLIGAAINAGFRYTTANLLAAMGHIKYNMIASGAGIIAQVLLDYFLIPRIGVMAVAVSNCFVYLGMSIFLVAVFYRKYFRLTVAEVNAEK